MCTATPHPVSERELLEIECALDSGVFPASTTRPHARVEALETAAGFELFEDPDDLGFAEPALLQERVSLLGSTPGNSQLPLVRPRPYTSGSSRQRTLKGTNPCSVLGDQLGEPAS